MGITNLVEFLILLFVLLAIALISKAARRRSSGRRTFIQKSPDEELSGLPKKQLEQSSTLFSSTLFAPKGELGERAVATELSLLNKDNPEECAKEYLIINDLLLVDGMSSAQIDHVVVSQYGVFVIETKTMSGTISGSLASEYWEQSLGGNLYKFLNPILQNAGHINAIRRILDDRSSSIPICSIIAFSQDADLNFDNKFIVHFDEVASLIASFKRIRLPKGVVTGIYKKLSEENETNPEVRKKHIEQAQQRKAYAHELIKRNICPRCGGSLVIRTGKKGQFYGCSSYPRCRFTLPLSKDEDRIRQYSYSPRHRW